MQHPLLIVNFKTYSDASGDRARKLAYTCEKVAEQEHVEIAIAPQNVDLRRLSRRVDIPVLAQHADPDTYGSNTGSDIVESLEYNGADGIIINHSEDQIPLDEIEQVVDRAQQNSLETIVCVDETSLADKVAQLGPDYIAYEPPELIGGDTSVTSARQEVIEDVVSTVDGRAPVLTGAGIKDSDDVATSIELGTEGVLVASGIVKADNVEQALRDLTGPL